MNCDGCGKRIGQKAMSAGYTARGERISGVYECPHCGAVQGTCYLGQSYQVVLPYMSRENVTVDRWRYFDFTTLGSNGVDRRHGWFDPASRLIMQVG